MVRLALAAALALSISPAIGATARSGAKPAVKRDWSRSFAVTPEGGFQMGNPAAKIAIVEYASLTCPHCRHFAETATKPLVQTYVRAGRASYEYRPFILNGADLAANLVARCGGPARFFPMAASLFATQPFWTQRIDAIPADEKEKLKALPVGELMLNLAKAGGLISVAIANGIAPARAEACLRDERSATRLTEMYQAAMERGINGTPTVFVNGERVAAGDWATLEPYLKKAGR